ncbi:hypothetical protein B0T17DRAFT_586642 [Bombardia bombarda]|uniref:KOW domain-containing protein n=1 Tax=Bombardia bombarda TaxID=252184 RepID=A0AA40CF06_9PEZI|nr:hypothetical protein B0T17DRAFT_586642 [Bombardia bombarda]
MDKLLRRVRMAEGQVVRRNRRRGRILLAQAKTLRRDDMQPIQGEARHAISNARIARRDEWEKKDLKPNYDVSKTDEHTNYWGSMSSHRARLATPLTPEQKKARCAWAGGEKYLCLAPGDRVVVTEGPFKGTIAPIAEIERDTMTLELKNELRVNVTIPEHILPPKTKPVQVLSSRVPISAVRLVHPLPDASGRIRDVVIRELKPVNIYHDRPTRRCSFGRVVPGENVLIPWPRVEPKKREEHPSDTLRIDVEERTFVPTLLRSPMPATVVNELRNAYSIFRTRHTPEYIAAKEAEEAEKRQKKKNADSMLLPVQEFNRKQRELRRARGQPVLSEEMLEKIGEVIARNKRAGGSPPATSGGGGGVEQIQSAVAQLSLGSDVSAASETKTPENQPQPSS